eukprot:8501273-Heterocapsa_arctica.AAC.1
MPAGRVLALAVVDCDVCAPSSRGSRIAVWAAWIYFATAWGFSPLPTISHTIRLIAVALKAGGYRSIGLFFSHARQEHLRILSNSVCAAGEADIKDFARSMVWDFGPTDCTKLLQVQGAQSCGYAFAAEAAAAPLAAPDSPFALIVLGGWWMCCSIQLSAADCSDLTRNIILALIS